MAGCVDYQYGLALGDPEHHSRGECAIRIGELSIDPLGQRTNLMWDRLITLVTLDEPALGRSAWDDRLAPPLSARHPGDEEDLDDEIEEDDEDLDDDFDDEDDLDDDFEDDEDIDDEIDEEIDDIDIDEDEDEDLDEDEDEDLDEDEDEDLDEDL
jgi:hypothetical protein